MSICTNFYSYFHSGPENLKKSRQKTREIAFLAVLIFFPSSKIDFWPFLKLQKMEFSTKKFREIDLFDFTSFLAWIF